MRSAGRASAVGWELAIAVIAPLLLGHWADQKLGTDPWLTLVGLVLGSLAGFLAIYKAARAMAEEDGPPARDDPHDQDDDQGERKR